MHRSRCAHLILSPTTERSCTCSPPVQLIVRATKCFITSQIGSTITNISKQGHIWHSITSASRRKKHRHKHRHLLTILYVLQLIIHHPEQTIPHASFPPPALAKPWDRQLDKATHFESTTKKTPCTNRGE